MATKTAKAVKEKLTAPEAAPRKPISSVSLPAGIVVKRVVTLQSLVMKADSEPRALTIHSAIRVSTVIKKPKAGETAEKPANVCDVTDMETGEAFIFLVPSVVQSNLERDYPEEGYVGKSFYIRNDGKRNTSQRYFDFTIVEVTAAS